MLTCKSSLFLIILFIQLLSQNRLYFVVLLAQLGFHLTRNLLGQLIHRIRQYFRFFKAFLRLHTLVEHLCQILLPHQLQVTFHQLDHSVHPWILPKIFIHIHLTMTNILIKSQNSIKMTNFMIPKSGFEPLEGPFCLLETDFTLTY